jgi:hypothetical protein
MRKRPDHNLDDVPAEAFEDQLDPQIPFEEKIITAISRKHRSKEKLNYATGRRDFPALVSDAEAYFGSWGKALYAAGIDPNLYFVHHKCRERNLSNKKITGHGKVSSS